MDTETLSMLLQYVISPVVASIVLWLIWLTKTVMDNVTNIGINSALDEQTQLTLAEIKTEMKTLSTDMAKVLAKLESK